MEAKTRRDVCMWNTEKQDLSVQMGYCNYDKSSLPTEELATLAMCLAELHGEAEIIVVYVQLSASYPFRHLVLVHRHFGLAIVIPSGLALTCIVEMLSPVARGIISSTAASPMLAAGSEL